MKEANVGYIRVSTLGQHTERQLDGVPLDKVFEDRCSGKDAHRPQLQACLEYLREGDTLLVHSSDRLARNLEDLQRLVRTITAKGVRIRFIKEGLTFGMEEASPLQSLMFQMLGAFAQFERALLRERQREGIALAQREGRRLGRAKALGPAQAQALRERVLQGADKKALAREFGVSRQTVYRYLQEKNA